MPQPTKGARLGGSPAHQKLMLRNLATALFQHGRITTTEAKARRLRPFAERLITKAKVGDLHNRREIMRSIRDKEVVHRLCTEIGPFFADRAGGYTRITKTMPRKGDNAPMAVIELVQQKTVTDEANRARRASGSRQAGSVATGSAAAAATAAAEAEGASAQAEAEEAEARLAEDPEVDTEADTASEAAEAAEDAAEAALDAAVEAEEEAPGSEAADRAVDAAAAAEEAADAAEEAAGDKDSKES